MCCDLQLHLNEIYTNWAENGAIVPTTYGRVVHLKIIPKMMMKMKMMVTTAKRKL